jgi:hypothetical protein
MCDHSNQMKLRLITYTRYGPMVGCLACGSSWLVKAHQDIPVPVASRSAAQ